MDISKEVLKIYATRQKAHDMLLECDAALDKLLQKLEGAIIKKR